MDNAAADVQYSAWSGACYVTPLIGGYLADAYIGRYKAILVFCCIYLVGLVLVVIGSIPGAASPGIIFPAIYIIAIGTGGIKPNVSTMGADQFDEKYEQDKIEKESFFNWFYWSINLGAGISYTVVSYICQYGIPALGGEDWGFFVGYMIPCIMMGLAVLIFLAGTTKYTVPPPGGSVIASTLSIYREAIWTNRTAQTSRVLDRASRKYGGSYDQATVESVKLVTRLLPFLGVLVPFWGIYSQMSTAFQNQGCQMNLDMGKGHVPVSALNLFDTVAILLFVPLFDTYLYPMLKSHGCKITLLGKMWWGLMFAMLAMVVAGLVEIYRIAHKADPGDYYDKNARDNISPCHDIDDYDPYIYQRWDAGKDEDEPANCHQINGCDDYYTYNNRQYLNLTCISCDDIPQMSEVSVFWQIPQFCLIGVAEILASITSLEFFYSQAPQSMRSVSQALNLFTTALGAWVVIPLLYIVNSGGEGKEWVPENIDDGHLEYYFFLLAGLMVLNQILFSYISEGYEYKTEEELSRLAIEANDPSITSDSAL
eukprot:CAMPEP_0185040878 /NCGR_PEP_ID=MMETSP1103-20130426/39487_1 /TAXON_ID=36769 /ORGANISM="Paraphysomonas bandaiensis, Strain Caron Lab Isolate" /LENGTH=538 /DNA_ID=CAMNT_0027580373 /DNA_START=191 /DNA_END=1807 /DNA_ORIENTATION=+